MAEAGSIEVAIEASAEGLKRGLEEAVKALQGSKGALEASAVAIGAAITVALTASIAAFQQAERAATGLAVALRNQGGDWKTNLRGLMAFDEQLAQHSRFTDNEIEDAQTLLVTMGLQGAQLKQASQAMVDLGTQTGSLSAAARLLGNAYEGNASGLHRFGITIQEGTPKALVFGQVMQQLSMYQGRASADADTLGGQIGMLWKMFEKGAEVLGARLAPTVKDIVAHLNLHRDGILKFAADMGTAVINLTNHFIDFLNFFISNKAAFDPLLNVLAKMKEYLWDSVSALVALGKMSITGWKQLIELAAGKSLNDVAGGVGTPGVGKAGAASGLIGHIAAGGTEVGPANLGAGNGGAKFAGPTSAQAFAASWKDAYDKNFKNFGSMTERISGVMKGFTSSLGSGINGFFNDILLNGKTLGQSLMNIGTSMMNFMLELISKFIAQFIAGKIAELGVHITTEAAKTAATTTAIQTTSTAHTLATEKAILENAAEAQSGAMAAHAKIPFVGIAIGLAAAAAIFGIIMSFKKFALGGIIDGPTLGLLGETGQKEAVINLESEQGKRALREAAGGGGGNGEIHLHISGSFIEGTPDKWEKLTRNVIIPALERHGRKTTQTRGTIW